MSVIPGDDEISQPAPGLAATHSNRVMNVLTILLVVVALVLGVLFIIPSDYYILLPGDAIKVDPLVHVKGHPAPPEKGGLYLTDVTFLKADHLLVELYGRFNPDAELEKPADFTGGVSQTQYIKLNTNLMDQSIQDAQAAALSLTTKYKPHFAPPGPEIVGVLPNTQAAAKLKAGDLITAMNGHRVQRADQVRPLVQQLRPGQIARLSIVRKKRPIVVSIRTVAANSKGVPSRNGRKPLIGILLQDRLVFPLKITISHGNIIGPSAGLMFSLGILQHLSHSDLTKGCKIAGTGTIDYRGNVGEIGGAKQKIIAARHAGVRYFFVPDVPDNRVPAEQNRGDVKVVPVKTLRQAFSYLRTISPCR